MARHPQDTTENGLIQVVLRISHQLQRALVMVTPVRTGRMKRGWRRRGNRVVNRVPYSGVVTRRRDLVNRALATLSRPARRRARR